MKEKTFFFFSFNELQAPWFSSEPAAMQIRFEAYNRFNRVNINNWETNLATVRLVGRRVPVIRERFSLV